MDKPITMLINDYKKNLTDLINNSELPAWLIVLLTDPILDQVKTLANNQAENDRKTYEFSLITEEQQKKTEEE